MKLFNQSTATYNSKNDDVLSDRYSLYDEWSRGNDQRTVGRTCVFTSSIPPRVNPIESQSISFKEIQQRFKKNHGEEVFKDLCRGQAIIETTEQQEQYLHSYGPMVDRQWNEIKSHLTVESKPIDIFDYGCGQGLGTIQIFDHLKHGGKPMASSHNESISESDNRLDNVTNVNLIEPSSLALSRAKELVCYYPTEMIPNCINKKLDDLNLCDLVTSDRSIKLHIFSNVLDIQTFDPIALLEKVLSLGGRHQMIGVSPQKYDGARRLRDVFQIITARYNIRSYREWDFSYKDYRGHHRNQYAFLIEVEI